MGVWGSQPALDSGSFIGILIGLEGLPVSTPGSTGKEKAAGNLLQRFLERKEKKKETSSLGLSTFPTVYST